MSGNGRQRLTPEELAARDDMLLGGARGGEWLAKQHFDPLTYAIEGLIPEGFTLLVGPPKVGKSSLVLGLQLAKAAGLPALGAIDTGPPRPVVYFALEDGHRRMQDRCLILTAPGDIPAAFAYFTVIQPGQVINTIEAWLRRVPDTAMIVVDTLAKATSNMKAALAREANAYMRDYKTGDALKTIADNHRGLSLVAVHHARKSTNEDQADFIEKVNGTAGLTGSADTVVVLERKRGSPSGLIQVTGRDVAEGEYAMTFNGGSHWRLDGRDLAEAAKHAAGRGDELRLGDVSLALVASVRAHPEGIGAGALRAEFPDLDDGRTLYARLGWLAKHGYIRREGRGTYYPADDPPTQHTQQRGVAGARARAPGTGSVGFKAGEEQTQHTQHTYAGDPARVNYLTRAREEDWPPGTLGAVENAPPPPEPPDTDEPDDV